MYDFDGNWVTIPRMTDMPDLQMVRLLQFSPITPDVLDGGAYKLFSPLAGSVVIDAWVETPEVWDTGITLDVYAQGGTIRIIDKAEVDVLSVEDGRVRLRNDSTDTGQRSFYLSTNASLVVEASGTSTKGWSNIYILIAESSYNEVPQP